MNKQEPIKFKVLSDEGLLNILDTKQPFNSVVDEFKRVAKEAQNDTLRQVVKMLDGIGLPEYEEYYPQTTLTPRYHQSRMASWSKGQLCLLQTIRQVLKHAIEEE